MAREKLTDQHGTPSVRQLPEDAHIQMLGTRIHAMLYVREQRLKHDMDVKRLPTHHRARIRAAQARADLLSEIEDIIDDRQKACAIVLAGSRALKSGRQALAEESET